MPATVTGTESPTPLLRRVFFTCPDLTRARPPAVGAWLRGYFPTPDAGTSVGPAAVSEVASCVPRAYTLVDFDRDQGSFALDFVLHGLGPAALWAAGAKSGDVLPISGPLGRGQVDQRFKRWVFLADTTALPAVRQWLAALRAGSSAIVHLWAPGPGERQDLVGPKDLAVTWHYDQFDPAALIQTDSLTEAGWSLSDPQVKLWIAGEAGQVTAARQVLAPMGLAPGSLAAAGYWRRGQPSLTPG